LARAAQNRLAHFGGNSLPGLVETELVVRRDAVENRLHVVDGGPWRDGAVRDGQVFVLHDQLWIEIHDRADARALGTSTVRTVEREHSRCDFRVGNAALDAGKALAEVNRLVALLLIEPLDLEQVLAVFERDFEGVAESFFDARPNRQPIDQHFNGMTLVLVEDRLLAQLVELAVDFRAHETSTAQIRQFLAILALAVAHDGRKYVEARTLGPRHDAIADLLHALLGNFPSAVVAECVSHPGEQQPQVVVDLGYGADGRTRIVRGGLLLDRDSRREPLDRVEVGLLHLLEELARVRGQRLDIAPLPFRVDRVKRQRGL